MVQNTIVQPNELALETPYIINNIKATRSAFNLDEIEVKTFNPEGNLTAEDIKKKITLLLIIFVFGIPALFYKLIVNCNRFVLTMCLRMRILTAIS